MTITCHDHYIATEHGPLYARSWEPTGAKTAPIVLLHDSLGCVELWRDFPKQLALASGRRVIAYDRLGFGRSAAYPGPLPRSFIEDEAHDGFQALCEQLGVEQFVLFGHSVGGAIAAGCAAAYPSACQALISEGTPAFVQTLTRDGIRHAERQFAEPGQLQRLANYHGDKAHWVLRSWVDTWLADDFSDWNLGAALAQVRCPTMCLHGEHDEYGTEAHPRFIAEHVAGPATVALLPDCGHVPHRQQAQTVLAWVSEFLRTSAE